MYDSSNCPLSIIYRFPLAQQQNLLMFSNNPYNITLFKNG